jgi:hypothetical protein
MAKFKLSAFIFVAPLFFLSVQPLFAVELPVVTKPKLRISITPHPTRILVPSNRPTNWPTRTVSPRPTRDLTRTPSLRPTGKPSNWPTRTPILTGRYQSCQAREAAIKARSENLVNFSKRLITTFDKISTKVQEYYQAKKLNVPNYSALVADIALKKTAVQNALVKAQAVLVNFNCAAGNPKTSVQSFNENMKLVNTALNNYKTSVRKLIVAVRSQVPSGIPTHKPTNVRPTKGGVQ